MQTGPVLHPDLPFSLSKLMRAYSTFGLAYGLGMMNGAGVLLDGFATRIAIPDCLLGIC